MLREQGIAVYILSDSCGVQGINSLSDKISRASDEPLSRDLRANVTIRSTALYIYTSGTTGTNCIIYIYVYCFPAFAGTLSHHHRKFLFAKCVSTCTCTTQMKLPNECS